MNGNLTVTIPAETTTAIAPSASIETPGEQASATEPTTPPEQQVETGEQSTPTPEQATAEQAAEALSDKGLDVSAFEHEFEEKGELSPESYKKLADAGFGKEVVDRYIQANAIIAEKFVTDMKALAGGEQGYVAMSEWARTTLDAKEVEAFNKATASGDPELTRFAVSGLYARYQAAEGKTPELMSGKASSANGQPGAFRSTQEVVAAMRDPRYGKDAAYMRDIEQRMARSNVF